MTIFINNKPLDVAEGITLAEVVAQQQLPERGVAVAVDSRMIQRADWQAFTLEANAHILIIKAACGG